MKTQCGAATASKNFIEAVAQDRALSTAEESAYRNRADPGTSTQDADTLAQLCACVFRRVTRQSAAISEID
jgi:hypothetical protein